MKKLNFATHALEKEISDFTASYPEYIGLERKIFDAAIREVLEGKEESSYLELAEMILDK